MTTKEYLSGYKSLQLKIETAEDRLENVVKEIARLQAIDYSKEKIQAPPKDDPVGNLVIEIIKEKGMLCTKIIEYRAKKLIIENQVEKLLEIDPKAYEVLVRVYITDEGYYNTRSNYCSEPTFYRDMRRAETLFSKMFLEKKHKMIANDSK